MKAENINKELYEKGLIDKSQFIFLDSISSKKIISVYYELRTVLFLGILLLTGGIGYFAYENLGEVGHIISMLSLAAGIVTCFYFINKHALPYDNKLVEVNHPYHDYIILLVALLVVALLAYIIVYFEIVDEFVNWSSLISALLFLTMAYRYDNKAILSMGITALAATVGLSISPVGWLKGGLLDSMNPSLVGLLFGAGLVVTGQLLFNKNIKQHFTFTYHNFGLILFFLGCNSLLFNDGNYAEAFFMLITSGIIGYYFWNNKEFLFFLYANIFGYIAVSYIVIKGLYSLAEYDSIYLIFLYLITSSIGAISVLLKKKKEFKNE